MISNWPFPSFVDGVFLDIAEGLIASTAVGACALMWRRGIIQASWERMSLAASRSQVLLENPLRPYRKVRADFIRWLRADQSRKRPHYGQFGLHAALKEEARYQTGHEDISTKPRMFLTFWPVEILKRRGLLPYSVMLAMRGSERLLVKGRVRVFQSAEGQMSPLHSSSIVSFRHTLAAASILISGGRWSQAVRNIVGAMLDVRGQWQNRDGGWAQCDQQYTESDLYASSYALRILSEALKRTDFNADARKAAEVAVDRTLSYFEERWTADQWKHGDATPEENAPYVLGLIAPILLERRPLIVRRVVEHMSGWMTQTHNLSEAYLRQCAGASELALSSRLAYAMYRAGMGKESWLPLYECALEHRREDANSTEISFVIDLTYAAHES